MFYYIYLNIYIYIYIDVCYQLLDFLKQADNNELISYELIIKIEEDIKRQFGNPGNYYFYF